MTRGGGGFGRGAAVLDEDSGLDVREVTLGGPGDLDPLLAVAGWLGDVVVADTRAAGEEDVAALVGGVG